MPHFADLAGWTLHSGTSVHARAGFANGPGCAIHPDTTRLDALTAAHVAAFARVTRSARTIGNAHAIDAYLPIATSHARAIIDTFVSAADLSGRANDPGTGGLTLPIAAHFTHGARDAFAGFLDAKIALADETRWTGEFARRTRFDACALLTNFSGGTHRIVVDEAIAIIIECVASFGLASRRD